MAESDSLQRAMPAAPTFAELGPWSAMLALREQHFGERLRNRKSASQGGRICNPWPRATTGGPAKQAGGKSVADGEGGTWHNTSLPPGLILHNFGATCINPSDLASGVCSSGRPVITNGSVNKAVKWARRERPRRHTPSCLNLFDAAMRP